MTRVLFVLLLSACVARIERLNEGTITCGECPTGLFCAPRVGLCFETLDETAPTVAPLSVNNRETLTLVFNEAVSVSEPFTIDGLEVITVGNGDTPNILRVQTGIQTAEDPYVLRVRGVTDVQGNPFSADIPFVGFGVADRSPVSLVGPIDGEPAYNLTTTLRWSPATGARRYTVEISLDDSFTNPMTMVVEQPEADVTFEQPTRYYWRVTADVSSAPSVYGEVQAVSSDFYVSPSGTMNGLGNTQRPFGSVQRALDAARILGAKRVLVAAGTYNELIHVRRGGVDLIAVGPVTLHGYVTDKNAAHRISNVIEPMRIEGFTFSIAGPVTPTRALLVEFSSAALTLSNIHFVGDTGGAIFANTIDTGPLLEESSFQMANMPENIAALSVLEGALRVRNASMTLTHTYNVFGVSVSSGRIDWQGGSIDLTTSGVGMAIGVYAGNKSIANLTDMEIRIQAPFANGATFVDESTGVLDRVRIRSTGGISATPVTAWKELTIKSSLLDSHAPAGTEYMILVDTRAKVNKRFAIEGSTFVTHGRTGNSSHVWPADGFPAEVVSVGSLFVCLGTSFANTANAAVTFAQSHHNAFVNCGNVPSGSTDSQTLGSLSLTSEYRLVDGTLASAGTAIDGVPIDLDGNDRTSPYSIGAYEKD